MKKTITLVIVALLAAVGAKAEVIPSSYYSEPDAGTYYLYNVTQGKFLDANVNLVDNPTIGNPTIGMNLETQAGNTYSLTPNDGGKCIKMGSNGSQFLWRNDNYSGHCGQKWSFTEDGTTKTYHLSITADQNYDNKFNNGETWYLNNKNSVTTTQAEADKWSLITEANFYNYKASTASIPAKYYTATVTAGTYYLYSPYSSCFLYATSDHAGLQVAPAAITFTANGDDYNIQFSNGKYLKYDAVSQGNTWANGDNGEAWSFTSFHDATGLFFIKHVTENSYLYSRTTEAAAWGGECWGTPDPYITRYAWALISDADYKAWFVDNSNGDITSLIQNANCNSSDGWTGSGSSVSTWGGQNWRGTSDGSDKYLDVGGLTYVQQTLTNMPAGYYKLVAALRAQSASCTITPYLNETAGTAHTGMEYGAADKSMINTQGVQITANSNFDGYSATANTRGWQWGTASLHLESAGDLTVKFALSGSGWKCVDDVHIYYSETEDGFYTITDANNNVNASKVLTCDIVLTNPNTIISSDAAITTASGVLLNNNLVSGTVSNLVLYDGYEFSATSDFTATSATLYRNIAADGFATVCTPFAITGGATGTFYQPSALSDVGVLSFESVDTKEAGKAYLLKATAEVTALTGSGTVKASPVANGTGVTMNGQFTTLEKIPHNDYVLSGSNLYKVNSDVSCNPFRAYFTIGSREVKANVIKMNFDGVETGIAEVYGEMVNGKSVNGKWFNLAGQRVSNPKHGIYVVNGKKVVIK